MLHVVLHGFDGSTADGSAVAEPVKFAAGHRDVLRHPFDGGAKTFSLVAVDVRGTAL